MLAQRLRPVVVRLEHNFSGSRCSMELDFVFTSSLNLIGPLLMIIRTVLFLAHVRLLACPRLVYSRVEV
jgi:hypothetical protein